MDELLSLNVKPLIFCTHFSERLSKYHKEGLIDIGIHPNFRSNSSHGQNVQEVCDYICNLFPEAIVSRSHGFVDSLEIQRNLFKRGIKYDSNELLKNSARNSMKKLDSGIKKVPCFWSDGMIIKKSKNASYDIKKDRVTLSSLSEPGYKVLNIHPILFLTNSNNYKHYEEIRKKCTSFCKKDLNLHLNKSEYGVKDYFYDLLNSQVVGFNPIQDFNKLFQ